VAKEIELKLEIAPESAASLLASDLLATGCREIALHATYFDTAKHELHRQGHSLRIRSSGGKTVQTVKAGDVAAGLFSRGEWELPVTGKRPMPDGRTPVSDLLAKRIDELVPLFEVPNVRNSCRLNGGNAEIEVAIDRAEAVAGDRVTRFCELELELLSGDTAALFALARKIDAVAPVRISVQSKAERGYQLLGPLPNCIKAEQATLDPCMDLPAAFAAIANSCLKQYRMNEAILLERYVPEAVHQARIGLRRLRSAMTLFKDVLTGPEAATLKDRVSDLARCLGEARDFDVLAAGAEPGPLLERLSHSRDGAHSAVQRRLKAKGTRLLLLDLSEWIADGDWRRDPATQTLRETPLCEFAANALDRLRRKTAKHGKHLASLNPEARHRVRKDAKKLRYAVEFLAPLFGEKRRRKKFSQALQSLQDDLGGLNDHASAQERLASLGLAGTAEVETFLARWNTDGLLEKAAKARHALLDVKPFWH